MGKSSSKEQITWKTQSWPHHVSGQIRAHTISLTPPLVIEVHVPGRKESKMFEYTKGEIRNEDEGYSRHASPLCPSGDTEHKGRTCRDPQDNVQEIPDFTDPAITGQSKRPNSPKGDTEDKGRTPRDPNDSVQELANFTDPPITGHSKRINNSKRNDVTTGGTQSHSIRMEVKIFGNKENIHCDVNTDLAEYSTSSESTNGNVQTITQVAEYSTIDHNDTESTCRIDSSKRYETTTGSTQYHDFRTEVDIFGNKDNRYFNINTDSTTYSKSFNSSKSANETLQTITEDTEHSTIDDNDTGRHSEHNEDTIPMAKEDEKETKKNKKKKNIFSTLHTLVPSKPKKAELWLTREESTGGENKMSVAEQQVKAMTQETERLARRCGFHIEILKTDDKKLKLCPEAFLQSISSVDKHILHLRLEKDGYINRLSSAAASRIPDNNPNITNLPDPNSPTKLAEMFNKIYHDQWTDLIERLEKKGPKTEKHKEKCVYHLYSVLMVIFNSLSKKAEIQLQDLSEHLFLMVKPSTEQIHDIWDDYKDARVHIIASRKKTAEPTILMLHQTLQADSLFVQGLRECSPPLDDVMLYEIVPSEYFKKCVEICWHFVIQDPPMYVENVSIIGTKIGKDTHKVYTKSGDIVKYHVWPALYLHHQDGTKRPLMGKSVVQPE